MPRPAPAPRIVSANDLLSGEVVYLAVDGGWTRDLAEAAVAAGEAEAATLLARAEARPGEVVGPYLAEVDPDRGAPVPTHLREALRARGPSIALPSVRSRSPSDVSV